MCTLFKIILNIQQNIPEETWPTSIFKTLSLTYIHCFKTEGILTVYWDMWLSTRSKHEKRSTDRHNMIPDKEHVIDSIKYQQATVSPANQDRFLFFSNVCFVVIVLPCRH